MSEALIKNSKENGFPPGAKNSFYFQFFNTASFGCVLGVPIILFFKDLGASVTTLGIITSLAPLLIILQIPASRYVEQTGYRRFTLNGWAIRTTFILGLVLCVLLPQSIDNHTRMMVALFFLIGYNISRGISTCGFMPWISQLIPEKVRGRFLAIDQMTGSISGLITTLLITSWLHFYPEKIGYAGIFFFAAVTGFVSIYFLRKIPDVPIIQSSNKNQPIRWKELLSYPAFKKVIVMNIVFHIAIAGGGLFWVPLLKDHFGKDSSFVLSLVALGAFFSLTVQFVASKVIDKTGSKPALIFSIWMGVAHFMIWSLIAAKILPLHLITIVVLQGTASLSFPLYGLANTRLVMASVPKEGRSQFFAIFSVAVNLTLGILPWFWGLGVDCFQSDDLTLWGHWHANVYSVAYLILIFIFIYAWILLLRIEEHQSMSTEKFVDELFVKTPKEAITRLLSRRAPF